MPKYRVTKYAKSIAPKRVCSQRKRTKRVGKRKQTKKQSRKRKTGVIKKKTKRK